MAQFGLTSVTSAINFPTKIIIIFPDNHPSIESTKTELTAKFGKHQWVIRLEPENMF